MNRLVNSGGQPSTATGKINRLRSTPPTGSVDGELVKFGVRCSLVRIGRHDNFQLMRDLLLLAIHLLVTLAKFLGPGGARRVVAESRLLKHQPLSEIAPDSVRQIPFHCRIIVNSRCMETTSCRDTCSRGSNRICVPAAGERA
jgi:hypothetical protein